jgi:hypothetical protein
MCGHNAKAQKSPYFIQTRIIQFHFPSLHVRILRERNVSVHTLLIGTKMALYGFESHARRKGVCSFALMAMIKINNFRACSSH